MAADMTFLWGYGESCDSPGSEPPLSVSSQGTHLEKEDCNLETWHKNFRAFTCSEKSDPIQDLRKMAELCHLWLRPDLHTKEQILDKLVIEQFMISMPQDLQVLVKESGVKSCKDLEDVLRNNRKPKKWSIVSLHGQEFLVRNSDVQMAEEKASDVDYVRDLFKDSQSSVSKIHPEKSQKDCQELQSLPGINKLSRVQGEEVFLPETIPAKSDLEDLRPRQNLGKDLIEDRKETTVLQSQEPQLPKNPAASARAKDGKKSQEETSIKNVDANMLSTHVLERNFSTQSRNRRFSQSLRSSKRIKRDAISISQERPPQGTTYLENKEFSGQVGLNSVSSPSTIGATGHPVGQGATGLPSYECRICKKSFQYQSQFILHQRTHTGERPFKCSSCEKGFMQPSDLRVHQRIHTGEKPYECETCHKKFAHESTLHGHKRIHTREKPYECKDCKKFFSHRGNLNVHRRIHSGTKPYKCDECNTTFRQQGTFKRHLKVHSKRTSSGQTRQGGWRMKVAAGGAEVGAPVTAQAAPSASEAVGPSATCYPNSETDEDKEGED